MAGEIKTKHLTASGSDHAHLIQAKSAYNQEKYIITKRNKPVAALVSCLDGTGICIPCYGPDRANY